MADKRVIEQTASTELYNDDWFLKDSVVEGTTKISAAKLKELLGADGTQALEEIANAIAEEYDSTHTYSLNSWVFHEGVLYRCISQSTTGTWDATKWQAKTIKEFIDTAKNSVLSTIEQMLGEYMPFSTLDPPSIEAISKGDIFIYQRTNRYKFYRAKADHPQGVTEFDIDDWDEFDTVSDLIEDVAENAGKVADVQVKTTGDYETVVENKIAKIDLSSVTAYGEVPNLPQPIATFTDGADDIPIKSLVAEIEPVQDLHGYDAPWVGGAGKNLFNKPNLVMNKAIPQGTVIYGQIFGVTASFKLYGYDENDNEYEVMSLSVNKNSTTTTRAYTRLEISQSALNALGNGNLMVSLSDFTTFEPYSNICPISGWDEANITVADDDTDPTVSNVYTIDLDGTRYGGKLDVVSGVLTVDRVGVDLGSLNWLYSDSRKAFNMEIPEITSEVYSIMASCYAYYGTITSASQMIDIPTGNLVRQIGNKQIFLKDNRYTDVTALKEAVSGQIMVYPLATPTTIQLTPTAVKSLLGSNNVWADTGDVNKCVYRRDMSSTIDDIIARLEALEG